MQQPAASRAHGEWCQPPREQQAHRASEHLLPFEMSRVSAEQQVGQESRTVRAVLPFAFPGITLGWVHSSGAMMEGKVLIASLWLRNAAINWPNWDLLVGGLGQLQAVYLLQGGGCWVIWLLVTLGL